MVRSITPLLSLIVLSIMLHEERPGITAFCLSQTRALIENTDVSRSMGPGEKHHTSHLEFVYLPSQHS